MSHVGLNVNIHQPNKECMSCEKWVPIKKTWYGCYEGGYCKTGYCKKNKGVRK